MMPLVRLRSTGTRRKLLKMLHLSTKFLIFSHTPHTAFLDTPRTNFVGVRGPWTPCCVLVAGRGALLPGSAGALRVWAGRALGRTVRYRCRAEPGRAGSGQSVFPY